MIKKLAHEIKTLLEQGRDQEAHDLFWLRVPDMTDVQVSVAMATCVALLDAKA